MGKDTGARSNEVAQPNNGMHPTADTLLLTYIGSFGAAGDAGR
jgi:hypothetical protein